ncbi:transposase [Azospirillum sp. Vi22]|nr:transposase [Azospirillum baldaniorum]
MRLGRPASQRDARGPHPRPTHPRQARRHLVRPAALPVPGLRQEQRRPAGRPGRRPADDQAPGGVDRRAGPAPAVLEKVRKSLRAELPKKRRIALKDDRRLLLKRGCDLKGMEPLIVEAWCNEFPQLGAAYRTKEGFAAIWGWGNQADARAGYEAWVRDMPADIRPAFQPLITAITNWEAEVFAYFRHPITNAFTECMNGLSRRSQSIASSAQIAANRWWPSSPSSRTCPSRPARALAACPQSPCPL